jgi:hypothetical protein
LGKDHKAAKRVLGKNTAKQVTVMWRTNARVNAMGKLNRVLTDDYEPSFLEVQDQYDVDGHYYTLVASFQTGPSGKVQTKELIAVNDHTQTQISFSDIPSSHHAYLISDFARVIERHLNFYESDIEDYFADVRKSASAALELSSYLGK